MSDETLLTQRIDSLDDLAATAAAESLAKILATSENAQIPASGLDDFESLINAAKRDPSAPLGGADPGPCARSLLNAYAADKDYAPLVDLSVSRAADNQLATKPILAVGVAASLIIIAASTDVKIKYEHVEIHKTVASPELVRSAGAVLRPIVLPASKRGAEIDATVLPQRHPQ
jgi:hypothetical protein